MLLQNTGPACFPAPSPHWCRLVEAVARHLHQRGLKIFGGGPAAANRYSYYVVSWGSTRRGYRRCPAGPARLRHPWAYCCPGAAQREFMVAPCVLRPRLVATKCVPEFSSFLSSCVVQPQPEHHCRRQLPPPPAPATHNSLPPPTLIRRRPPTHPATWPTLPRPSPLAVHPRL